MLIVMKRRLLSDYITKQLPVLTTLSYRREKGWPWVGDVSSWIRNRAAELTLTSKDLEQASARFGFDGMIFRFYEDRGSLLRAELGAAYFLKHGLNYEEVKYVLDSFSVLKEAEVDLFGNFRTKELVLSSYVNLKESSERGVQYVSTLASPPADPRVAYDSRGLRDT